MNEKTGCWALVIHNNKVLLIKNKKRGYYEAPGGKVENKETAEKAIIREVEEETNIKISVVKNIEEYKFHDPKTDTHWTSYGFLAKYTSGTISNSEPEKMETVDWFSITELPQNINPNTKKAIEKFITKEF